MENGGVGNTQEASKTVATVKGMHRPRQHRQERLQAAASQGGRSTRHRKMKRAENAATDRRLV
jgi:hypothetical protein